MTLEELRTALEAAITELRSIDETAGDSALTAEQQARFDELIAERDTRTGEIAAIEARQAQRASLAPAAVVPGPKVPVQRDGLTTEPGDTRTAPNVIIRQDPFAVLEDRSTGGVQRTRALVDANLRAAEHAAEGGENQAHFERILKRHAADHRWAENILGRSRPEYVDGFSKLITGRADLMTNEERAAVAIGTSTQGGALVPTALDPTLMITNVGSSNVMRAAGTRKVTLTEGNIWYGVTTAGVTASWDAELAAVSDDSPSVASASITCYKAQGFVAASVEAFQDIASLQSDVLMLFADARDRLEGAAHMTGSGSAPQGIFTLINASSSLQTVSTTGATIGEVDVHALYRALPVRWRGKGTFITNPLYNLAIKRLGTAVSSAFSGDLTQPVTDRILGRPVLESDDAPTTQTTTALDQEVAFLSLQEFVIVDKPGGVSIEFVPMLFDSSTARPNGSKGWYMRWRTGSGMPNLAAGRCLVDKTSA